MGAPRILRIFRARVKPGNEVEWNRALDAQIDEQLMGIDGLVAWYRGRPVDYESNDFVFVTIWRDKDALRHFAGASAGPVWYAQEEELAETTTVEQFEIAE